MTSPITATQNQNSLYPFTAAATSTTGSTSSTGTATPPTGIVGTDGSTNTDNTQTDGAVVDSIADDKDLFLKLLVAQMSNQDPDSPTDSSQYLSQMASFSEVEQLQNMATETTSMLAATQMSSAVSLLGDTVTYGADNSSQTGKVTGVTVVDGTPQLLIGTTQVPLTEITAVAPVSSTTSTSSAPSTSSTGTTGTTGTAGTSGSSDLTT